MPNKFLFNFILIGLTLGAVPLAQAWDINSAEAENYSLMRMDPVYLETRNACTNNPALIDETVAETNIFKIVFGASLGQVSDALAFDPSAIISVYKNKGLSPVTTNLLRYQPFLIAVNDCFPWDTKSQNLFIARFIVTDVLAKVSVAGGLALAGYGASKVTKMLAEKIPMLKRYVRGGALLLAVMVFFDMAQKQRWSPTEEEKTQMIDLVKSKTDGARESLKEANLLLESEINEMKNKLASLDTEQKLRFEKLNKLHQRNLDFLNSSPN